MNLVLKFREYLSSIGQALVDELEQLTAAINTVWAVEHSADGTHLSFTSPEAAITSSGDATFTGGVVAGDENVEIGSLVQSASPSVAGGFLRLRSDGGLSHFRISAFDDSDDELRIADLNQTISDYILRLKNNGGAWFLSPNAAESLTLGRDALGERITDIFALDAHFSNGVYERGRTARMGEWTAVPFNAANFTANGTMTWTLQAGDQISYTYTLIGKTMFLAFTFNTTSVGGVPSTELRFAIPGGFTAVDSRTISAIRAYDNGTETVGFCGCVLGQTYIRCWRAGFTSWAASANNTSVQGLAIFEVQ